MEEGSGKLNLMLYFNSPRSPQAVFPPLFLREGEIIADDQGVSQNKKTTDFFTYLINKQVIDK